MQQQLLEDNKITLLEMEHYLNIYLGESDWRKHISILGTQISKYQKDKDKVKQKMKQAVCYAILMPMVEQMKVPDIPHKVLFWANSSPNLKNNDWVAAFKKEQRKDKHIEEIRMQCFSLGVIYPIDYSPMTRQAFNWLMLELDDHNSQNARTIKQFSNMVSIYGGRIICNIFEKNKQLRPVTNWNSAYFFERLIHSSYKPEDLLKIKSQELAKTNKSLIKNITIQ